MAQRNFKVGAIKDVSGEVNIAGGDIYRGFTAEQVFVLRAQITSTFQPKPFDGRRPYKGLDGFEEEDAGWCFGRERLIEDLPTCSACYSAFKKDHFINPLHACATAPKRRSSSSAPARTPTTLWGTAEAKWMVWKCCGISGPKSAHPLLSVEGRDTVEVYKLGVNSYSVKPLDLEQFHRGNVYSGSIQDPAQPAASAFGVTHND
jgi:hypothetical protein